MYHKKIKTKLQKVVEISKEEIQEAYEKCSICLPEKSFSDIHKDIFFWYRKKANGTGSNMPKIIEDILSLYLKTQSEGY